MWLHCTQETLFLLSNKKLQTKESEKTKLSPDISTEAAKGRKETEWAGSIQRNTFPSPDIRQWEAKRERETSLQRTQSGLAQLQVCYPFIPPSQTRNCSLHALSHYISPPLHPHLFQTRAQTSLPTSMNIVRFLSELIKSALFFYSSTERDTSYFSSWKMAAEPQGNPALFGHVRSPKPVTAAPGQSLTAQIRPAKSRSFQCKSALILWLTHLQRQDMI